MMRNVMALTRREMISIFCSPLAYVVLALFLVFPGVYFILSAVSTLQASISDTFLSIQIISLLAIPLITMRLLSDEYRTGSIELLMTAPVTDTEVVAGKFFGAMAFYLCMLAPTLLYVAILRLYGGIDLGPVVAGYAGLALTGAMFVALGLFCSALTQYQVVSGTAAMVALLMLLIIGAAARYAGPDVGPLMEYVSLESHMAAFSGGRIPLRDSFYFISFTAFFLFLAARVVESRRWRSGGAPGARAARWQTLSRAGILLGIACVLAGLVARQILAGGRFTQAEVLGPMLAGAALTLGGIILNLGWIWSIARRRRFLTGLNVWAAVALSVVLLATANAIVMATPQTDAWVLDMNRERIHALSEKSRNILKGLDREAAITVLCGTGSVSTGQGGKPVDITRRLKDLMRLYGACGVKTQWVDVYSDNLKAQQVALALKTPLEPDTLVITAGERRAQIPFLDLFEIDYAYGTIPMLGGFQAEEKITSAIVSLIERKPTVYFLTGHGEFAPAGEPARALNEFAAGLRRDNMKVEKLNLSQSVKMPEDCGLLVIAGPTAPFPPEEAQRIEEYLDGGGRLLLLAIPRLAQPQGGSIAGLESALAGFNLRIADDQVVVDIGRDPRSGGQMLSNLFSVPFTPNHQITKDLGALNCFVQNACPVVALTPESSPNPGGPLTLQSDWLVTPLIETSERGWGESNIPGEPQPVFSPGKDLKGPVAMAAAISRNPRLKRAADEKEPARIVALGSTSILDDVTFSKLQANRTFAMNCVNWLTERETHLGIAPQRAQRRELAVSPTLFRAIFFLTVLGMPLAAGIAGVWVWWARRR